MTGAISGRPSQRRWLVIAKRACLVAVSALVTLLVVFSLLETFPALIDTLDLGHIPYYEQKARLVPHPRLVFVDRLAARTGSYVFNGDQYRGAYSKTHGLEPLGIPYSASFNAQGFRVNSSPAPYDVVVVGDSYVAIGEADDRTFSELLKRASGKSVYNLGRPWYGPYQYNELLREHVPSIQPRYVVYCFFDGNDVRDVVEYEKWLGGDGYYHFSLSRPFFRRFVSVLEEIGGAAEGGGANSGARWPGPARVRLGERDVWMTFGYRSETATAPALLRRPEWQSLRSVLAAFRAIASQHGIKPLLLFIPHKVGVYGEFVDVPAGDDKYRTRIDEQLRHQDSSAAALRSLAGELDVRFVDLSADFRRAARRGELLYYPVDSHWNLQGRAEAARVVSEVLAGLENTDR